MSAIAGICISSCDIGKRELSLHLIDVLASQSEHAIGFLHRIDLATFCHIVSQQHRHLEPLRSHVRTDQVRRHRFDRFRLEPQRTFGCSLARCFDRFSESLCIASTTLCIASRTAGTKSIGSASMDTPSPSVVFDMSMPP